MQLHLAECSVRWSRFARPIFWHVWGLWLLSQGSSAIVIAQESVTQPPDKVVVTPGGRASSRITLTGEILELTGDRLRIRLTPGDTVKEYPAVDVVEVTTPQVTSHQRGLEEFHRKDYVTAEATLKKAFDEESRTWVKREILVLLVRTALKRGDYLQATTQFALLLRSDPRTSAFPLIPLLWVDRPRDETLKLQAEKWLLDEDQPAAIRLMGASILLQDRRHGAAAALALRDLAADSDRRVGGLAGCQQWRLRIASGKEINLTELKIWETRVQGLPEALRGGPEFLLGQAYRSRREFELAAVHLLWLPLTRPDDQLLASTAMLQAAEALETIGQLENAAGLYEELQSEYATTPAAELARDQLESLLQHRQDAVPSQK